jgi:hypothetical protein
MISSRSLWGSQRLVVIKGLLDESDNEKGVGEGQIVGFLLFSPVRLPLVAPINIAYGTMSL